MILDNGAYEGEMLEFDELVRISNELKPNVLTIPDKINDAEESLRLERAFLYGYAAAAIHKPALMRVLQHVSRDVREWMRLYKRATKRFTWIAFPRALGMTRTAIVSQVHQRYDIKVHAFGWIGSVAEVAALAELGVTTMDSSGPVWRGLNGYDLSPQANESWQKYGEPCNFEFQGIDFVEEEAHARLQADNNLTEVLRACVSL